MDGEKVASMAREYGLSRERVYQIIREQGISCKNSLNRKHAPLFGSEKFVFDKLVRRGVKMKVHANIWYDLETESGKKIEVKHRRTTANGEYYRVSVFNKDFVDFVVFVTGEIEDGKAYVIPSKECPKFLTIPKQPKYHTKRNNKRYLNNWKVIS